MKLNQDGINLIKSFESCSLKVYKDIRGLNTVGYGHRTDLPEGTVINVQEAETLLENDLSNVCKQLNEYLKIPLSDNQYSALVSFVFNLGIGEFANSTMLKMINAGGINPAAQQFERWDMAGDKVVDGLLRRRLAEKALYLKS